MPKHTIKMPIRSLSTTTAWNDSKSSQNPPIKVVIPVSVTVLYSTYYT